VSDPGFTPWVPIPAELLHLRRAAIASYLALGRYAGRDGRTTTGVRRIAADTGLHTESVVDAVKELMAAGLVIERAKHGRGRTLELPAMVRGLGAERTGRADRTAVPAQSDDRTPIDRAAERAGTGAAVPAPDCAGARAAVPAPTYQPSPGDLPTLRADDALGLLPADPERARLVGGVGATPEDRVELVLRELAAIDAQADPAVRVPRSPRVVEARLPSVRSRYLRAVRDVVAQDPGARIEELAARARDFAHRPPDVRDWLLSWVRSAGRHLDEADVRAQCRSKSALPDVEVEVVSAWGQLRGVA
jgi:hypothetical protein